MFEDSDAKQSSDHPVVQEFSRTMHNIRTSQINLAEKNQKIRLRSQFITQLSKKVSDRIQRKTREIEAAENLDEDYEVNENTIDETIDSLGIANLV